MATPVYKIEILDATGSATATQQFQDLLGITTWERMQVELLTRPGVDGVGVRELGSRGTPFEIVTLEYRTSLSAARTAAEAYQDYIGSGAPYGVRVTQADVDQGVFGVLDVRLAAQPHAIATAVGSLIANPGAVLLMRWTLVNQELSP